MPEQALWHVKAPEPALAKILSEKLAVSQYTAQLLVNRGIYTVEHGRVFLESSLDSLNHPFHLKDMGHAAKRILKAASVKEQVMVYGDYDADGITATALLVSALRRLGLPVEYHLPNRLDEGYGLHLDVLKEAFEKGVGLVVTVDCGVSGLEEAHWARKRGLDLIITDHHEPGPELPEAFALINPKRLDCDYPFKDLAGAGVAFKLAQALLNETDVAERALVPYLEMASIGTVADVVPLRGENRIIVKHGLLNLARSTNPGLQALMKISGINKDEITTHDVGFRLAPRINAAGRIGNPELAIRLLLADNYAEAWEIANELNRGNQARQKIESDVFNEAYDMMKKNPELAESHVIVLASENWHVGVIGIVASRLMEIYLRPVLLISVEGEVGKGSSRSPEGFDLYRALTECGSYLIEFGGHARAAGFSIKKDMITYFREALNKYAQANYDHSQAAQKVELDLIMEAAQVSESLVEQINLLQPFGHSNPQPLFACLNATILDCRSVGKDAAHLKLRLHDKESMLDGIGFNLGAYAEVLAASDMVDIAFVPGFNEFNGIRSLQLEIRNIGFPANLIAGTYTGNHNSLSHNSCDSSLEDLKQYNDLFVSEFILNAVKNDYEEKDPDLQIVDGFKKRLVDRRGTPDRPGLLAELVEDGYPAMIIANCPYQTIELVYFLNLARPSLKNRTAFCHSLLSPEEINQINNLLQAGRLSTIVATPLAAKNIGRFAFRVLLYDLLYNQEALYYAMKTVLPEGRIFLLYGPSHFDENVTSLDELAPDRNCLAVLYRLLRQFNNGIINEPASDFKHLTSLMVNAGFARFSRHSLEVSLKVMEELQLLDNSRRNGPVTIGLSPRPKHKKSLEDSATYIKVHSIKKKSVAWMHEMLQNPAGILFKNPCPKTSF